jgi:AraC-like DNA-binding protein
MVAGAATSFYDLPADKESVLAGLRLRPGAASAVVGRPVSEFTDRQVLVDSIFGVRGYIMAEKVLAATTPSHRVAALQNVLTSYFADVEPLVDAAVTWVVGTLRRHPDRPVSSLAAAVDLSERQLRRRFEAAVGYGPKRFGRIVRFQRLLDLIHSRGARVRWAELAIEADYADQPHMINECAALAGMSPIALPRGAAGPTGDVSVSSNTAPGDTP